jgi:hypothetical protein
LAKDDETGFDAEDALPAIVRRGTMECQYAPALGAAICARVAAGESVRAVCRDAAMPSAQVLYKWARNVPAFGAAFAEARRAARRDRADRAQERREGRWRRWKGLRPHAGGRPSGYGPGVAQAICARLMAGESLKAICARADMPAAVTVYGWLRAYPDFARAYGTARRVQALELCDRAWEIAAAATPETVDAARLKFKALVWRASRLAPVAHGLEDQRPEAAVRVEYERAPRGLAGPID